MSVPAWSAEKTRLRVDDYQIEAELNPHSHKISARTKVKFTALDDLSVATFELNNALRLTKVTDANNKTYSPPSASRRIPRSASRWRPADQRLQHHADLRVRGRPRFCRRESCPGLKLAPIGDDTTYLLYASRWFPVNGYGLNRFTSTISVTVPAHMVAIGSGKMSVADSAASKKGPGALPGKTYTFVSDRPSFPGTIIAGVFQETKSEDAGVDLHVFFKPLHQKLAPDYTNAALKEFTYYITAFGPLPSPTLRVMELPDDTVPTAWAPEIAAIASRAITDKTNYRLLANTIAHQWWGSFGHPLPRTIGGLPTASPAIPKPCTLSKPQARWDWKKR